jgi:hypothetical protein
MMEERMLPVRIQPMLYEAEIIVKALRGYPLDELEGRTALALASHIEADCRLELTRFRDFIELSRRPLQWVSLLARIPRRLVAGSRLKGGVDV